MSAGIRWIAAEPLLLFPEAPVVLFCPVGDGRDIVACEVVAGLIATRPQERW